jgi:Uracil DNA glycosylase superfamily
MTPRNSHTRLLDTQMRCSKEDRLQAFVQQLAGMEFPNVFNPYGQICPVYDTHNAAAIRRRNLELVLAAALNKGVNSIWMARDLGYKGGRRTGLALTDEPHLPWQAALWGTPPLARSTIGPDMSERTAAIVWKTLRAIEKPIFLWNVFPFHPHTPNAPMSNRCHTRAERDACRPFLVWLLAALKPEAVVAIGSDAQAALRDLGVAAKLVRHPSYGGQTKFTRQLFAQYGLED